MISIVGRCIRKKEVSFFPPAGALELKVETHLHICSFGLYSVLTSSSSRVINSAQIQSFHSYAVYILLAVSVATLTKMQGCRLI